MALAYTDDKIKSYGDQYNTAKAQGDTAGMATAHNAAESYRKSLDSSYQGSVSGESFKAPSSPSLSPASGTVGVRDYLVGQGYDNGKIGWDQATGQVLYNGAPLVKPGQVIDGRSYATPEQIQGGLYGAGINQYKPQVQQQVQNVQQAVQQPFNYDPSQDPAFNSASNAVTRNVMESLNNRGILNSTVTRDDTANAVANIIPQLQQQAYQRYQGNIQNQFGLQDMFSGLENQTYGRQQQQELTAYQRDLESKNQAIQAEQRKLESAWARVSASGYVDNESSKALGIPVGTPSFEARKYFQDRKDKLAEQATDNSRQWAALSNQKANQQQGLLMDIWQKTGTAPAGIPGVPQGTPLYSKTENKIDQKSSTDNYFEAIANLEETPGITKAQAKQYAQDPAVKDNLADADYKRLLEYVEENY